MITLLTTLPWSNTLSDGVNGWLVSRPSPGAPTTIVGLVASSITSVILPIIKSPTPVVAAVTVPMNTRLLTTNLPSPSPNEFTGTCTKPPPPKAVALTFVSGPPADAILGSTQ